jgi:hypothetical protein
MVKVVEDVEAAMEESNIGVSLISSDTMCGNKEYLEMVAYLMLLTILSFIE